MLVFSTNTYHHIQERPAYFRNLRKDLAPGGRVAIIEYNDASWFPRTFGHATPKEEIVRELREAGYPSSPHANTFDHSHGTPPSDNVNRFHGYDRIANER